MGQKIKITATLAKSQNGQLNNQRDSDDVEYQWHWARVLVALLLIVVLLVTATVYLFPNDSEPFDEVVAVQKPIVAEAKVSVPQTIDESPEKTEKDKLSQYEGVLDAAEVTSQELVVAPQETTSRLPEEVSAATQDEVVAVQKVDVTRQDDSALADIALGAQMDTQWVSRALLTRGINEREPVDIIGERIARASFTKKLYFFTQVNGLKDKMVRHKWYFQGQLQADVALSVYSERYRTFSSKNIAALQLGVWRVELVADQQVLAHKQFIVTDR